MVNGSTLRAGLAHRRPGSSLGGRSAFLLPLLLAAAGCGRSEPPRPCGPNLLPVLVEPGDGILEWNAHRAEIRGRIHAWLGNRPQQIPPPAVERGECTALERTTRCRITYAVEVDERIPAWLFLPPDPAPAPGVIAFHQTAALGKDEAAGLGGDPSMAYALELANEGYAVIAFDDVAAGERIVPGYVAYDTRPFYARHPDWSALDKAIWDGSRAVDAFCTFAAVDCTRLAAVGHSQGGNYAWMLAAEDPRVQVVVANAGYIALGGDPGPERWSRDGSWVGVPLLHDLIRARQFPFDFDEWLALDTGDVLMLGYQDDQVFPNPCGYEWTRSRLEPLLALEGTGLSVSIQMNPGPHAFPPQSHQAMIDFLRAHLGPPPGSSLRRRAAEGVGPPPVRGPRSSRHFRLRTGPAACRLPGDVVLSPAPQLALAVVRAGPSIGRRRSTGSLRRGWPAGER